MQTLNVTIDLLRLAIRDRKQVVGTYHSHPRVFCPHILGHKDERTTRTIYAHTDPASLASASDVLDLNIIREAKKSR